jgi:AcrR family transcriptional regulator
MRRWTSPISGDEHTNRRALPRACCPGSETGTMSELASKPMGRPVSFDHAGTVKAAMDLYWRSGVANTSFNEVSRALNVSKPTLYRYFGDEDGLLSAALQHYVSQRTLHAGLLHATGDIRTDLNAWFGLQIDELYEKHHDGTTPTGCLLMECVQLGKALGDKTTATVNSAIHEFLEMVESRLVLAAEAGQLQAGINLKAAVHLIAGQMIVAKNVVLIGEPKDSLKSMVALAIEGITA